MSPVLAVTLLLAFGPRVTSGQQSHRYAGVSWRRKLNTTGDALYSCKDLIPGTSDPMCTQFSTQLTVADGCAYPCLGGEDCVEPQRYDCVPEAASFHTATTPLWGNAKCEHWQEGGGKCDAETGCPLCRKKMTTCSQGGTFLPTANRPYSALSIPYECRLCPRGWKSTQTDSFVKGDVKSMHEQ